MFYIIILYLSVVFGNVIGNVFFKIGSRAIPTIGTVPFTEVVGAILNKWFFLGIFGFVLSFPAFMLLLTRQKISIVYPIVTGLTFVIISLVSVFYLKESLSAAQIVGIFVIFLGLTMLA